MSLEIHNLQVDAFVLDHLQLPVVQWKNLILDIIIVVKNSLPIELHLVRDTLNFTINEQTLDLLTFFLSKKPLPLFFLIQLWKSTVL